MIDLMAALEASVADAKGRRTGSKRSTRGAKRAAKATRKRSTTKARKSA